MPRNPKINQRKYTYDGEVIIPSRINDVRPSHGTPFKDITSSPAWMTKAQGTRRHTRTEDLVRTDFRPYRTYGLNQFVHGEEWRIHSPISAVFQALCNGPRAIKFPGGSPCLACMDFEQTIYGDTSDVASMANILEALINGGWCADAWMLNDIDQLIGALCLYGPAVVVIPWYEHFGLVSTGGRSSDIRGEKLGLRAVCVGGYAANGLLIRLDPCFTPTFGDKKGSFWLKEDDLAELISDGGEAYGITKPTPY